MGIHLGTTNSVVGVLNLSDQDLVLGRHGEEGSYTMPSAVAWLPGEAALLVGHAARNRRGLDPAPILSVKRRMGMDDSLDLGGKKRTPPRSAP